jgi:hypothetical protein
MQIPVCDIPTSIMTEYNHLSLAHKGHVLIEVPKGMYGLTQAGIITNKRLVKHLATHGRINPCRLNARAILPGVAPCHVLPNR